MKKISFIPFLVMAVTLLTTLDVTVMVAHQGNSIQGTVQVGESEVSRTQGMSFLGGSHLDSSGAFRPT